MHRIADHFRGALTDISTLRNELPGRPDGLDLTEMARDALNYLRGNPDPDRDYECKFSLGPLGIPAHVPLLAPNCYAFDPIALGDTDCRMDWQYSHMREMAGESEPDPVELGVRRRILGYQRPDHLVWMNPGAWVGPLNSPSAIEALKHEWAFSWATGKLLFSLSEEFNRTGDASLRCRCRGIFLALRDLTERDQDGNAYLPYGASPWRNGEWLHLQDGPNHGWGSELSHGYPFITEPLVRYWECTGDEEALVLARAMADGHIAGAQPNMGKQRIDSETGEFRDHVHLHTHEVWGVAHLGAVLGERRYLDWAERVFRFVLSQGTDYGWYPEFIPQPEYRTEICVVGDMISIGVCLARGQSSVYWDHVERMVRNVLRTAQFRLSPEFVDLFMQIHEGKPEQVVEDAVVELRKLEGGFVAQPAFDDWVSYPDSLGTAGIYSNGIHMMGCCPPEGMRGLWEAWCGAVERRSEGVFINMALTRDHSAASVVAYLAEDGGYAVTARAPGTYFLRPPAWATREDVRLSIDGEAASVGWGGPDSAYVVVHDVQPGQRAILRYSVPQFTQTFIPASVPGRSESISVRWAGNSVAEVLPHGRYLRMFG